MGNKWDWPIIYKGQRQPFNYLKQPFDSKLVQVVDDVAPLEWPGVILINIVNF